MRIIRGTTSDEEEPLERISRERFIRLGTALGVGAADGSVFCSGPGGGLGSSCSGTTGGPPSSPAFSVFSRQSRGPSSGNVAQPASARTSASPTAARRARPITGSTVGIRR